MKQGKIHYLYPCFLYQSPFPHRKKQMTLMICFLYVSQGEYTKNHLIFKYLTIILGEFALQRTYYLTEKGKEVLETIKNKGIQIKKHSLPCSDNLEWGSFLAQKKYENQ